MENANIGKHLNDLSQDKQSHQSHADSVLNTTESLTDYLRELEITKKTCSGLLKYKKAEQAQKKIEETKKKLKTLKRKELQKNHEMEVCTFK